MLSGFQKSAVTLLNWRPLSPQIRRQSEVICVNFQELVLCVNLKMQIDKDTTAWWFISILSILGYFEPKCFDMTGMIERTCCLNAMMKTWMNLIWSLRTLTRPSMVFSSSTWFDKGGMTPDSWIEVGWFMIRDSPGCCRSRACRWWWSRGRRCCRASGPRPRTSSSLSNPHCSGPSPARIASWYKWRN